MNKDITIEEIKLHMDLFERMYQVVRIVDPTKKKVLLRKGNIFEYVDNHCYSFWSEDKICENCISYRAIQENDITYKLEYTLDKLYMVTAMPIKTEEDTVVLEMIKEVTGNMLINEAGSSNIEDMKDYITNMNDKVVKDALTGMFNRRFIDERLPIDIIQSILHKKSLSLIMTDIDHFKDINDTYGHVEGDCKVIEYGKILYDSVIGEKSWVARYGGDEFIICLLDTDSQTAYNIAMNIRKSVETHMLPMDDNKTITGSFGVYTMEGESITAQEMIEKADFYLFKAKEEGRNRVSSSEK